MKEATTSAGRVSLVGIALEAFDETSQYLSESVVESLTTKSHSGETVCRMEPITTDPKSYGGDGLEGAASGNTSSTVGLTYREVCEQEEVVTTPENSQAQTATFASGVSVKTGKILMFIKLENILPRSTSVSGLTTSSGEAVTLDDLGLNMAGKPIFNVSRITGFGDKWSIDEEGNIAARSIRAKEKICVGNECFTEDDIRVLLENSRNGSTNSPASPSPTPAPAPSSAPVTESDPSSISKIPTTEGEMGEAQRGSELSPPPEPVLPPPPPSLPPAESPPPETSSTPTPPQQ